MKNPKKPDSHTHNRSRRRLSGCCRHPSDPVTGICPSCLRERLSGLDPSAEDPAISLILSSANAGDSTSELRRCRSVSNSKCKEASCSYSEPRRKSCDVRGRNRLSDLFDDDDDGEADVGGSIRSALVQDLNLGFGDQKEVSKNDALLDTFSRNVSVINEYDDVDEDEVDSDVEGAEVKTMKEHIDLEIQSKDQNKSNRNLWEAASVFSKRLRKWKQKQWTKKKLGECSDNSQNGELKPRKLGEALDRGRRSCDTEPRFSVDAGRVSFDEPRASWDGYMIAKTIPRLAPMLSLVDNGTLGCGNRFDSHRLSVDGQMEAIIEDESSSAGSGQSNSDSSSSQRMSSFDRSSSVRSKKTVGLDSDEARSLSNVRMSPAKLIITESELKDWRLKSVKDDSSEMYEPVSKAAIPVESGGNLNGSKKAPRWWKMFNVLGLKAKPSEKKCDTLRGISVEKLLSDGFEKQWKENGEEVKDASGCKIIDSGSIICARKSFDMVGLNQSMGNGVDLKDASSWKVTRNGSIANSQNSFDTSALSQSMKNSGEVKDSSGWKLKRNGSITSSRSSFDFSGLNQSLKSGGQVKDASGWKLTRNGSIANSQSSFDISSLNPSMKSGGAVKDASGWKLTRNGTIASSRSSFDFSGLGQSMKSGGVKEASGWKLTRSGSVASSRRSLDVTKSVAKGSSSAEKKGEDFVLELSDNVRRSSSKVDDEALPFYLTPLRSSRSSKSGRHRPQNSFSHNGNI